MIFKQIPEIVSGTKTETRRIVKPGEGGCTDGPEQPYYVYTESRRLKWLVGRDYAVQPGRGKRGALWIPSTGEWYCDDDSFPFGTPRWEKLRIKILSIHREPLQAITRDGAWLEGITGASSRPITDYRKLWDSINKLPGTRWKDDPQVWVIEFEVLREVER